MILDCFTFFNELEILEIRLHELSDVVDRFVLVESVRTHAGKPKPLYYADNRDLFRDFNDRIVHVVVRDPIWFEHELPGSRWTAESQQRNAIAKGWRSCLSSDIVAVSDVDEIPSADGLRKAISMLDECNGVATFKMRHSFYKLNLEVKQRWTGTYVTRLDVVWRLSTAPDQLRQALRVRIPLWSGRVEHGVLDDGWHFSFMGDAERIHTKLAKYSHDEHSNDECRTKAIQGRVTPYHHHKPLVRVDVDDACPAYVRENRAKFERMVEKAAPGKRQEEGDAGGRLSP